MTPTIFVTGATGQQGGATARALLANGVKVHALARDPTSTQAQSLAAAGVQIFKGDMLEPYSLQAAMAGVTGVFLNTFGVPPNPYVPNTEVEQARNVISAALGASTVKHIVVSTVICADRHKAWAKEDPNYGLAPYYGTKYAVEEMVRGSGIEKWTILRPAWLMHNYFGFMPKHNWPELESEHVMAVSYVPETKLAHCSPKDVGRYASAAFLDAEKYHSMEIDLASENLTVGDVARLLGEAAGVEVKTRFRSVSETKGIDPNMFPGIRYQLLMANDASVYEVDIDKSYQYGLAMTSFQDYFKEENELLELRKTLGLLA